MKLFKKIKDSLNFGDGLTDLLSSVTNMRSAQSRNVFNGKQLDEDTMRQVYKTGTFSKILRLKTGLALNNSIVFEKKEDEKIYKAKIEKAVKLACQYQLGFGRGIVVIHEKGAILSQPLKENWDGENYKLDVFSGDMVTVGEVDQDLSSMRYYKPRMYIVKGHPIHWTRVADFTYVEPVEYEKPNYRYGGISEAELIYGQLINDAVVERASATIIEKNSSLFYKIKGFKELVMSKKEEALLRYITVMENQRSISGAGIVDDEDEVMQVAQALTNLKEVNDVSKGRLAMVTGIPTNILMGDNNNGLNSNGDNDQKTLNDTIQAYQEQYVIDVLNSLLTRLKLDPVEFKETQARTPLENANYDKIVIGNAFQLAQMGEDFDSYLKDNGITNQSDETEDFFKV